jgi:beta-phosphoglucomutase-like phosphatase (HAD superfamily)
LINAALEQGGLTALFTATVSSEEVERGKPAPDVYLEACFQLGVDPSRAAAIEDSHNGIRSAKAAGLRVIAIPNEHYPPDAAALAEADIILKRIADLTPAAIDPS